MTLAAGSVSVNDLGVASGTGLALVLYNALLAQYTIPVTNTPGAQRELAKQANAMAATAPYVVANALVTVGSGIPVSTTGSAAAQTGTTTAPGTVGIT